MRDCVLECKVKSNNGRYLILIFVIYIYIMCIYLLEYVLFNFVDIRDVRSFIIYIFKKISYLNYKLKFCMKIEEVVFRIFLDFRFKIVVFIIMIILNNLVFICRFI